MKFDVSDLIEKGLVVSKDYPDLGLRVLKYHKKVFYDNLWHVDERLLECRGLVVDYHWNIVSRPFKKVFNVGENGTQLEEGKQYRMPLKVNGFMAQAFLYRGELMFGTTGTLDSKYAEMAKEVILAKGNKFKPQVGITYLFEICHKDDPHIIKEEEGAYLIGARNILTGKLHTESQLDHLALHFNYMRPVTPVWTTSVLSIAINLNDVEGFMVIDPDTGEHVAKVKSPYYLITKFFARMGKKKMLTLIENPTKIRQQIDEEYYPLIDAIQDVEGWHLMSEQERVKWIREYLNK